MSLKYSTSDKKVPPPTPPIAEPHLPKPGEEPQETSEYPQITKLVELLKDIPDAPSEIQLQEWKELHKAFYMSSVSGDDIYIWKTIKRQEYKTLFASISQAADNKQNMLEEFLVRRCLLWPKATPEWMQTTLAGAITTLFRQIYFKSGFISDEQALSMIEKI